METKAIYRTTKTPALIEFPARLILSARRFDRHTEELRIVAFADEVILYNEEDLRKRIASYRALENNGACPYTYSMVESNRAEEAIAQIRADLAAGIPI